MHVAILIKMSDNVQAMAPPCPVGSKKERCFRLSFPLWSPRPKESTSTILERDERWSDVIATAHDSWIGIALCCKTDRWWWRMLLGIGATRRASGDGKPWQTTLVKGIASPTVQGSLLLSSRRSST